MQSFIIKPILGLKTSVAPNDLSLFRELGPNIYAVHCVDGRNVDYSRTRNACSKSMGVSTWSNSATATTGYCLGIYELYDNANRTYWIFYGDNSSLGRIYRYNGSRDPVRISDVVGHGGAIEFAYNVMDFYSVIRYGSHLVLSDNAEHTPYCADFNDTALVKLISSEREVTPKYLESWQRRIFGANVTDLTNGDVSIVWSNTNPVPGTTCNFGTAGDPPANHLFIPNDDVITGIKALGRNACFVYSENSIHRIDYFGNYATPFGLMNVDSKQGATNHHSIVDAGGIHYFFNKNYGFCEFDGQRITPISYDIEDLVVTIRQTLYPHIIGAFVSNKNKIAWAVPLEGADAPNAILYYDLWNKIWEREDKVAHYIIPTTFGTNLTMNVFINDLGYATMADAGNLRMMDIITDTPETSLSNTDGKFYFSGGGADDSNSDTVPITGEGLWDGYRIEPIMDFNRPNDMDLLLEIWFDLHAVGNYSLYCHYRGGSTVGECLASSWKILDEVSCNSPSNAVVRLAETNRYHQIKWGADADNEPFSVSQIEFKYVPEGRY